jgi:hypothetical protein
MRMRRLVVVVVVVVAMIGSWFLFWAAACGEPLALST